MTVRRIRATVAQLDNVTLKTSYGSQVTRREHVFVAVESEGGTTGFGEGSPLPHFSGERGRDMLAVIREVFAPALIGVDPFDVEVAARRLDKALPHHQASKAALVNALFDLQGKLAGRPVHSFLGGVCRSAVPIGGGVGIEDEADVVSRVQGLVEQGIRTVKFKVGSAVERDIRVIRKLRERFPDIEMRADANAGFAFPDAHRFLRAVADVRLQYCEQPLAPHDRLGLARLRQLGTPIAVDEGLFGLEDALGLVRAEAADVFIIKLIKLGGLHQARKVAAIAEAAGIVCVAVSPYETALGVAANLHLVASSEVFPYAAEVGTGVSSVRLPGSGTIATRGGEAVVPEGPGLGVDIPAAIFADA